MDDPRAELKRALALEHETERKLAVVAVIDATMQLIDFRAIVIGGLAVEFWTQGLYSTSDIDLYMPHGPAVTQLLGELGFTREGRHYVLRDEQIFVEAPGPSYPAESEEVDEVTLRSGFVVPVLSVEDVLVDRLHQFTAGGSSDVVEQGVALIGIDELNYPRLMDRAAEEGLTEALTELERIRQRVRRGEEIPSYELHEIAKRLQRKP